jgi:hypothetical protein
MTATIEDEEKERKPTPEEAFRFLTGRASYAFDVVLMGLAVGTLIDLAISPQLLAPPESVIVTNAMLPMIVALGTMGAITIGYLAVAALMIEHRRLDIRHHIRRPVHFHLRLAYHAYLIFAGAGICIWTQVALWRGHWVTWTFGVVLALVGNLVSQACRYGIRTDGKLKKKHPEEERETEWAVSRLLIAAGIALGIVGIVNALRAHH